MLTEIFCDKFMEHGNTRGRILFHAGLNTVAGSDSGSNSIGKSTFLMIIDFVFGGDDYVEKLADVQKEVGDHDICFAFSFSDGRHYFRRSASDYKYVLKCDENYKPLDNGRLSVNQYLSFLQSQYGMNLPGLSFRNAIGRFMRIYKRENLDEKLPLHQAKAENAKAAIEGLLRLTDLYAGIEEHYKIAAVAKDKCSAFKNAQKYQYIRSASKKSEYDENSRQIAELAKQADELVSKSSGGLLDLDSMQAEQISYLKGKLSNLRRQRTRLTANFQSLRADQEWSNRGFQNNYDILLRFFPGANIQHIEDIEKFHKQLAQILQKELSDNEKQFKAALSIVEQGINDIEAELAAMPNSSSLSKAVLEKFAEIDSKRKELQEANDNYIKKKELTDTSKAYEEKLNSFVAEQIAKMQQDINAEMLRINNVIYDGKKTAPSLSVTDASHYSFSTPRDGGTGAQYKGLVVFDLAMMNLTCLPVIAHDSIVLKHIEDNAIEKIMELYSSSPKQIFIAIDKESSYTPKTRQIIEDTKVLQLAPGAGALFGRTWNDVKS